MKRYMILWLVGALLVVLPVAGAGLAQGAPGRWPGGETALQPQLSLTKSDGLVEWYAGWTYGYTIVVTNGGPEAAADVVVTDALPEAVYAVAIPDGATVAPGGAIVWELGALAPGASETLTLNVRAISTLLGPVTNVATVTWEGFGPVRATDTTTIIDPGDATATPQPTATATAVPPSLWLPTVLR